MDSATIAQDLLAARFALGLSQGTVARDTGISRSQLSLFEGRKYLLDRGKLETLKNYYSERGYRFGDPANRPRMLNPKSPRQDGSAGELMDQPDPDLDLVDGFGVAGGIERARAEAWLDQIAANDQVIADLLALPVSLDWKYDPKNDIRDEAILQMARNYTLVRRLHGRDFLPPPRPPKKEPSVTGDLVRDVCWGRDLSDSARSPEQAAAFRRKKRRASK